jgi:hypothetical protein
MIVQNVLSDHPSLICSLSNSHRTNSSKWLRNNQFLPQERITADTKSDAKDSIRQSKVCSATAPEITISQIITSLDQKLDLFM